MVTFQHLLIGRPDVLLNNYKIKHGNMLSWSTEEILDFCHLLGSVPRT